MEEKETKNWCEKTIENAEKQISMINEENIGTNNIEYLTKLIDIHKDLMNEKYWEEKMMFMRYNNYNDYNDYDRDEYGRRSRDSRGRYNESGNYGRRGYDAKYRGYDSLDRMYNDYGRYMEYSENYGHNEDTKKSLKYMLESMEDFARMLKEDAQSEDEVMMIRQTAQRIAQM